VVDYGYEPFPADGYDPFGAGSYDPYPIQPVAPPVQEASSVPGTPTTAPTESTIPNTDVPDLAPWPEYSAKAGATPAVYNDYVNKQIPDYLAQLGYTPEEIAAEVAVFKKGVPSPLNAVPERSWYDALIGDPAQSIGKGVVGLVDTARELNQRLNPLGAMFAEYLQPGANKTAKDFLAEGKANIDAEMSDKQKALAANQDIAKQQGVSNVLAYTIKNPSLLADSIIESLPAMAVPIGAAGTAGKFALERALAMGATRDVAEAAAAKVAVYASTASEGVLSAGQVSSDINTALDKANVTDPLERGKWNAAAIPAGIITAVVGKFSPLEASFFVNKLASQGVPQNLVPAILKGASKEAIEEYLQSGSDKLWTNVGSIRTLPTNPKAWDGVAADAALGALTGAAMGGGMAGLSRRSSPTPDAPTPDAPTPDVPVKPDLTFEELLANLDEVIPPEQRTNSIDTLIGAFDKPASDKEATFKELTKELQDAGISGVNIEELLTGIKEQVTPVQKPVSFARLNKEVAGLNDVPNVDFLRLATELRQAIPDAAYTPSIEELFVALDTPTTPDKEATFAQLTAELKAEGVASDPGIESFLTQMRETIEPKPASSRPPITPAAPTPVDFGTLTDELRDAVPEYARSPLIDTLINELDDPASPNKEGTFAALEREIGAQRRTVAADPFMDALLDGIRSKIEAATAVAPDALQLNQGDSNENVTQDVRKDGYENGQKNEGQGGLQKGQEDGRQRNVQNEGQVQEVLIPKQPEGIQQVYPRIKTDAGNLPLQFANDVDRALYVVGRTQRRDATASDLSTWLQEKVYPGSGRKFVQARAAAVVQAAKTQAATLVRGDTKVVVPAQFKTGPGDAAIRDARVAGTEPELSQDQNEALQQLFPDDQLPEGTSAVSAAAQIAGAQDAIQKSPNASQLAAYIAADSEPVRPRFVNKANQAGTRQSNTASSAQVDSTGGQKIQPRLSRRGVRPGKGNSGSAGNGARTVAEGRASVLDAEPVVMRPYNEAALGKMALELSLLAGKVNEAEDLANYFQSRVDEGYGSPTVDMKKVEQAVQIQKDANQAAKMRKGTITPETLALFADPVTGEIFDSRNVRKTLEASALPASTVDIIKTGDVRAALSDLFNNGSTPLVRAIAGRLSDVYLGGATIKVQPIDKAKGVAGRFKSIEKLILLDPDTGLNERVFLHEAAHAATVHALANPVTKEQVKAVGELTDLYNRAKQSIGNEEYGMRNIAEFIAEAFANPDFQYQLYKTSAPDTPSFWQRFISAVVKLLGMDNLLGRTANVAEALFMAPNAEPSLTQAQYDALSAVPVGPNKISIERSNKNIIYATDSELSTLSLGKQIEKAVKAAGQKLSPTLNIKVFNTLKRGNAERWIKQWTNDNWKPIANDVKRINDKFSMPLVEVENFLVKLETFGRAPKKMLEFDPQNSNYKAMYDNAKAKLDEATKFLSDFETSKPAQFKELIGLAQKVKKGTDATVKSSLDARANMTKARLDALTTSSASKYMPGGFYLPLQLTTPDGNEVAVMKASLGQNFDANDPLSRVFAQAALTAYANENNREKQIAFALAKQYNLVDAATDKPLFEIGPRLELKRDKTTGEITEGQDALLFDRNAIGVWIDGSYYKMRVNDPGLRNALSPVPLEQQSDVVATLIGMARYYTQLMSVVRTGANPLFAVFNYLRDSQITAPLQLDSNVSLGAYYAALPGAMLTSFKNTFTEAFGGDAKGKFAEASKAGAFISQRSYVGLVDTVRNVELDLAPTLGKRIKAGLADPMGSQVGQVLLAFSQSLENGTRLAVYDAAIASKMTPEEAAYHAKTTTVNFERKGQLSKTAGPFFMFFNAKVQGTKTLYDRAIGEDANARTQAGLTAMVVLGLIAGMIGYEESDKDENGVSKYKKIPDFKRDSRIIFKEGTVGMPMPQEIGLFYVLGNSIADITNGGSSVGEGVGRLFKAVMQQASPFASAQTDPLSARTNKLDYVVRAFMPTLLSPLDDLRTNRDTFGRPIVSESMRFKGKPNSQKFTRSENETSIAIAKYLYEGDYADVSPATITYLAKWLEGGSITSIKNLFNEDDSKNSLTKRFIMNESPFYDTEQFKDAQIELNKIVERAKVGSLSERAAYYNEHRAEIDLATQFKKFEDRKSKVLFKNYAKMTDAQVAAANEQGKAGTAKLLAEWYKLKGSK
jgi:hypothetical protein